MPRGIDGAAPAGHGRHHAQGASGIRYIGPATGNSYGPGFLRRLHQRSREYRLRKVKGERMKALITVMLGVLVLLVIAACGGPTRDSCQKDGEELERQEQELRNSNKSSAQIERELTEIEKKWRDLDEKCADLFR